MRSIVMTVPPTSQVVTLAEAKQHLRVTHDDEDLLIQGLIDAAVGYLDGLDGVLGRALAPRTYVAVYDTAETYRLPIGPIIESAIVDLDGTSTITFTAGHPEGVPYPIKQAVLLHIGTLYENREQSAEKWTPTRAYETLLTPYRAWS